VAGRRSRRVRQGVCALLVASVAGLAASASVADHKVGWAVVWASLAAVAGAFAPTLFERVWRASGSITLLGAAHDIAQKVLSRVRSSSLRARMRRPMPMRVRFRSVEDLGASRPAVMGVPALQWSDSPLTGHAGQVASRIRDLPWRQLVVVGEPGAGKSVLAMMLVDQLLTDRRPGEPVPVLLGVSSWNPTTESVTQLVSRRLVEEFGLRESVATRLTTQARTDEGGPAGWWVMPVLDGLDEIDGSLHVAALNAVEQFAARDRPLVVTCRRREYQQAEAVAGVLARAAVVEMEPLQVDDLVEFLMDPSPQRQQLWEPVFEHICSHRSGLLAAGLSSPLMAGLAKDAFVVSDPGELLTLTTGLEITQRLIDEYVAVVYQASSLADAGSAKTAMLRRHDPKQAASWLESLAYLGYLDATRDLRWWRLPWAQLAIRPVRLLRVQAVILTAAFAIPTALVAHLLWSWPRSIVISAALGATLGLSATGLFGSVFAHEFQASRGYVGRGLTRPNGGGRSTKGGRFVENLLFALACGVTVGLMGHNTVTGLGAGLVCGLLSAAIPQPQRRRAASGPIDTLRANHFLAAAASARYAAVAATAFGSIGYLSGFGMTKWGLTGLVVFGAASLAASEVTWLRFRLSHLTFALKAGRSRVALLPWRLIAFLNDGTHPDRATLRINGNSWQFRHAIIQDQLIRRARLTNRRRRADAGDRAAGRELARLLREQGDLAGLERRADAGDRDAGGELALLLRERGDVAGLERRADAGDEAAGGELEVLLSKRGDAEGLERRADACDEAAGRELVRLLRERGDVEGLERRADAGDGDGARELAVLLREREDVAGLKRRAEAGDEAAARELAVLLRERGDVAGLRRRAEAYDGFASRQLVVLLSKRGDVAGLERLADAGEWEAARELAGLLRKQGKLDGAIAVLRRQAEAGDQDVARELVGLLGDLGRLDEAIAVLRRLADAGDRAARRELAGLLRGLLRVFRTAELWLFHAACC
jgi:hypothetical protein